MPNNILIVDDEAAITNGLAYDIDWGRIGVLEVFKANSVPAALEYLQNNKIDVVITDIRMPEMDGLELAARIKTQWRFAKTIFISGYDEFEYAQKAIDLGVFSYITKPIPNERLLETVARALRAIDEELDNARLLHQHGQWLPALRERELAAWIAKGRAVPAGQMLQRAGIFVAEQLFLVLVTVDDCRDGAAADSLEAAMPGMIDTILFAGRGQEQHFVDADDNILIVASIESPGALADGLRFMKGMAEAFQSSVQRTLGRTVSLFFGNIVAPAAAHGEYQRLLSQSRARLAGEPGVIMVPDPTTARDPSQQGAQAGRTNRLVEQVRQYVEENIQKEISVSDIAEHLHLHPNYLLRLFKEQTGQAVIDFLIHARIQKAKALLTDQDIRIYEVAASVGYDSVSHFSRIFKRETGMSPKDYQQNQ